MDKKNNDEIKNNINKEKNKEQNNSLKNKNENNNNLNNKINKGNNKKDNDNQNKINENNIIEEENEFNLDDIKKNVDEKNFINEKEIEGDYEKILKEKDENISEDISLNKEDKADSVNSNQNSNNCIRRINTEVEFEKIVAGDNESQNNIIILNNSKAEEKHEEEEDIEEGANLNVNNYLGDLYRDVVNNKKKNNKNGENLFRMSIYKMNLDNGPKDFGLIINAQLKEIKEKTLNYFKDTIKEFEKRYSEYINKIGMFIDENELKIKKVFKKEMEKDENLLEFADNNIFKQFENIYEIHENIFNSIEEHIGLLRLFLEQTNLIQQKNPLEYYINTNSNKILNCWFLNKINFQKLNLSNVILNKDLSEIYSRYICKKKDNNFSSISIKKDNKGNLSLESEFVKDNLDNLEKLEFIEMKSDQINSILTIKNKDNKQNNNNNISNVNIPSAKNLKSLSIIESDFSSTNFTKIYTPSLKKLKLKRTSLSLSLKVFFESLLWGAKFLQNLYLQKCYLDNKSLVLIFEFLSEKVEILDSLQNLSFSGNEITSVNMKSLAEKNCVFKNLQYLDFSKNNIFEFANDNFKIFPEIKVLDLSDNNMTNYIFFKAIKSQINKNQNIVLLSNNMLLINNKINAKNYRQYIKGTLANFKYKIKKLNFTLLYNKETLNQLLDLRISPMVKISLIKLNLSYCGLKDDIVCKFLQNNFGLLNLEELNLSNNFITIQIFNLILKVDISLEKLISLDLSMNNIISVNIEEYKQIEMFVNRHSQFKKIKLQGNTFVQELLLLYQIEKEQCENINKNLISRGIKFIVENENNMLIIPMKELFMLKDKDVDY